jgi:hypothetical protein
MESKLIGMRHKFVLPARYKIGTAFVRYLKNATGKDYKQLCDYMRMEFVLLMERLHCIYIEAFSLRDCQTKWWVFGKPRSDYIDKLTQDPLVDYIHQNRFRRFECQPKMRVEAIQTKSMSLPL